MVTLLKVYVESPIYGDQFSKCLVLLSREGKYAISRSTLYLHVEYYVEYKIIPPKGDEGTRRGRTPLVSVTNVLNFNNRVFQNSRKIETASDLSKDIMSLNTKEKESQGHLLIVSSSRP